MNDKRKWNVGVDMDGVLAQYDRLLLQRAHERFGAPLLKCEDITIFNTEMLFDSEYRQQVKDLALEKDFFEDLEPYPGCIKAVREMMQHPRLRVFVCTAPKKAWKYCVPEKYSWIAQHIDPNLCNNVVMGRDKSLYQVDVLIDDKPIITGAVKKPLWKQVYHDRPYNRVENGGLDLPRIKDWSDWKSILSEVLGEEL